jgi:uncharacterized protein YndB with AHSA1/START domain
MNQANRSRFIYVIYIRTTPVKLWRALTDPQLIRQYRFDTSVECDWKNGSSWRMTHPDRGLLDTGEILEIDPPRRMVIRWQNEWNLEFKAEGPSRCIIELEAENNSVKLAITHEIERPDSPFITAVSDGWPRILSNLKSLLETGEIAL